MEKISAIESKLNEYFRVKELEKDPGFSKFIPRTYDPLGFPWQTFLWNAATRAVPGDKD
jgi:hypothetical protein